MKTSLIIKSKLRLKELQQLLKDNKTSIKFDGNPTAIDGGHLVYLSLDKSDFVYIELLEIKWKKADRKKEVRRQPPWKKRKAFWKGRLYQLFNMELNLSKVYPNSVYQKKEFLRGYLFNK